MSQTLSERIREHGIVFNTSDKETNVLEDLFGLQFIVKKRVRSNGIGRLIQSRPLVGDNFDNISLNSEPFFI